MRVTEADVLCGWMPLARRECEKRRCLEMDDRLQIAALALLKAIRTYSAWDGEFRAYASELIRMELAEAERAARRAARAESGLSLDMRISFETETTYRDLLASYEEPAYENIINTI